MGHCSASSRIRGSMCPKLSNKLGVEVYAVLHDVSVGGGQGLGATFQSASCPPTQQESLMTSSCVTPQRAYSLHVLLDRKNGGSVATLGNDLPWSRRQVRRLYGVTEDLHAVRGRRRGEVNNEQHEYPLTVSLHYNDLSVYNSVVKLQQRSLSITYSITVTLRLQTTALACFTGHTSFYRDRQVLSMMLLEHHRQGVAPLARSRHLVHTSCSSDPAISLQTQKTPITITTSRATHTRLTSETQAQKERNTIRRNCGTPMTKDHQRGQTKG
ncbi:hypothetical protein IQ06DRAFT_305885 [Phaeosphaeriaceae sp. SRC1lsM3a]|nr:hypothetical protein IQ06DRAFT_305885 [Stagonospora sp. SRC1lsM3a]